MRSTKMMLLAFIMACSKTEPTPTPAPTQSTPAPTVSATAAPKPVVKVELVIGSVGNTMAFDKTELTVPAKSEVHLVFKNNATMDVMQHNWVLVHEGKEAKVGASGLAAGPSHGYVDPNDEDVLAYTPLALPGKTVETTFTAPKYAGKYSYICVVMGHYITMRGTLVVE